MRRAKKSASKLPTPPPGIPDGEVVGIDHPLATEEMVMAALPEGARVPMRVLKEIAWLLRHPAEYEETPPIAIRGMVASLNAAVDRDFRAAQEKKLKDTGKAR